ncbi:MAG: hypothetical protein AB7I27_12540 [Bacteriovoracaceae bacterium]
MWIILGVLFSIPAFAIGPDEKLTNVKILRVLTNNIIQFDRGLEDDINVNNHIKILHETEGFAARAICIKSSSETSYWRLYRVPNSEAFSKDYVYTLAGLDDQEIPMPEAKWRDIKEEIAEESKKADIGPNPFNVKNDLPDQLTENDVLKSDSPEKTKLFVEKNLNMDQLNKDFEKYKFSLYASPFTRQSINEGESLKYGFKGGNYGARYKFLTQFEQQQSKMRDPVSRETVSTRSTNGQAQFVIDRLTPSLSSLSIVNYNSTRFSAYATPKDHWQVGVVGLTLHMYHSKTWEYLDLSYVPLYDYRVTEIKKINGGKETISKTGMRHGFRLGMRSRINERVAFENLLWVRPFQDMATWDFEGDNLNLTNDLRLIFSLTEKLFFDYNFVYQKDKLWRSLSGLPDTNTINSLNLRYDFDL